MVAYAKTCQSVLIETRPEIYSTEKVKAIMCTSIGALRD